MKVWEKWYGDKHTNPQMTHDAVYSMPEMNRELAKGKKLIANPGCYPTASTLGLQPMLKAGHIVDNTIVIDAKSGYTGAGKKGIAQYESDERPKELDSPRQYALSQEHKHLKEMKAISQLERVPFFAPHICDYPCGMVVSIPIFTDMLKTKMTKADIQKMFAEHYEGCDFVKVRPLGYTEGMIASNTFDGRDDMEIEINGNDERVIITSRFDNLGKGASGAAMECLNIVLGVDDKTGLNLGE